MPNVCEGLCVIHYVAKVREASGVIRHLVFNQAKPICEGTLT